MEGSKLVRAYGDQKENGRCLYYDSDVADGNSDNTKNGISGWCLNNACKSNY